MVPGDDLEAVESVLVPKHQRYDQRAVHLPHSRHPTRPSQCVTACWMNKHGESEMKTTSVTGAPLPKEPLYHVGTQKQIRV